MRVKGQASKEYVRPVTSSWWLQRPTWTRFMLRELTALFVGGYAVFLLWLLARAESAESLSGAYQSLTSPVSILLHLIVLAMVVYHAVTWFNATPKAVRLYKGEERVSPALLTGWHYAVWAVVSAIVLGLVLGLGR